MAHERHVDLPNDFDALLRQTMAVEPSAEFLPRVRRRIAAEPRSFSSWWDVALAAGSAAAALVLVLWPTQRPVEVSVPPPPRAAVTRAVRPAVPAIDLAQEPPVVPRLPPSGSLRAAARVVAPHDKEAPLIVVDERQRTALAAVIRLVGEGQLTDEAFAQATPPSMDAIRERVTPVRVVRVGVSPIVVGDVLPVGSERN